MDSIVEKLSLVHDEISNIELSENKNISIDQILFNLGFNIEDFDKNASTLSGGWQMRLALARVLLKRPDILLLDEPTNYLDILSIEFLKKWILEFDGQVLFVSHDRDFLNSIVEETWELFNGKITVYKGNYDFYLTEKDKNYNLLEKKRNKQIEEINRLQKFVDKNRAGANTASQAQSKLKQLEAIKEDLIVLPENVKNVTFRFPDPEKSGKIVSEVENIHHSYGKNEIITGISKIITRNERIAILGKNGIGKSTLLNIISSAMEPTSGSVKFGTNVSVSYFRQNEIEHLPPHMSVLEYSESVAPFDLFPKVKSILATFNFFEDSWDKKISVLSGGEKVKLSFLNVILNPGNFIILDEPTTHLDINSREILLKNLINIDATIIFVSHDIYFVDHLATSIFYFNVDGDIVDFPGNYSDYISIHGEDEGAPSERVLKTKDNNQDKIAKSYDYSTMKANRNLLKTLKRDVDKIENSISELEAEKENFVEKLSLNQEDITSIGISINRIDKKIEELMLEWEEKNIEMEELKSNLIDSNI